MTRPDNKEPLKVKLNLPGKHNVQNALALIALANIIGIEDSVLLKCMADFPGVGRRFHVHGEIAVKNGSAILLDDYGHHPLEIKVTMEAVRQAWPDRRIVLAFQPHRYTRTRDLMQDFVKVLCLPDLLLLLDVYSAGEPELSGINGETLFNKIKHQAKSSPIFVPCLENFPEVLRQNLQANDVVILQGAGSIGDMVERLMTE